MVFSRSGNSVRATLGVMSVRVDTIEELQILEEIYLDGIYNFDLNAPLLIVDIGMNVGYTAVYFAGMHPEAVIFAYEPFAPTLRCAEANIQLNPTLRSRVHVNRFGLSDLDRSLDIEYTDEW